MTSTPANGDHKDETLGAKSPSVQPTDMRLLMSLPTHGRNDMKVKDRIEMLQGMQPDAEVRIAQPTHNYWNEVQAAVPASVSIQFVDENDTVTEDESETVQSVVVIETY